jgi:selenocysteine lyase/cysteine desulfurase
VRRFAETMTTRSYAGSFPEWLDADARVRVRLADLIGADSPDDVALLKNTSDALSQVAHGLDWQPGDRVVALAEEFVSNLVTWEALEARGVAFARVAPAGGESPEDALEAACDGGAALMTVSTVQYGTGYRMDVERLGRFCRERGILFCVDAIQSLGALRFDARACHADFVVSGAHKWLMSPFGVAAFWCRPGVRDRVRPLAYGWHTLTVPLRFAGTLAEMEPSARRYEAGTANWAAILGFDATLSLLDEVGMDAVEAAVLANAAYLTERLVGRPGVRLVSSTGGPHASGSVCVTVDGHDLPALAERLENDHGVLCAARGPALRFSPHYYTPRDDLDRALQSFDRACML